METVTSDTRSAKNIAPEDIVAGDFVAILRQRYEYVSYLWFRELCDPSEPVRITFLPTRNVGEPLKVLSVCLPFVAVSSKHAGKFAVDVRTCELGRLDEEFVRAMAPAPKKNKKPKNKKRKRKAR